MSLRSAWAYPRFPIPKLREQKSEQACAIGTASFYLLPIYQVARPMTEKGAPVECIWSASIILLYWRFYVFLLQNSWVGSAFYRGPVVTDSAATKWIGGFSPHQHTGERSAIYHALKWRSENTKDHALRYPAELTENEYCFRRFANNSSQEARCTKPILPQRVRHLLLV